jgi:hypothetical protein
MSNIRVAVLLTVAAGLTALAWAGCGAKKGAPAGDRPPDCLAENWIVLGDGFGIAITAAPSSGQATSRQGEALKPGPGGGTLRGHMMVRRDGVWLRFEPEAGPPRAVLAH